MKIKYIEGDAIAGEHISNVAKEMCDLASKHECTVEITFNATKLHARSWTTVEEICERYNANRL